MADAVVLYRGEIFVGALRTALDHFVDDFAPLILGPSIRQDALRVVAGAAHAGVGGGVLVVGRRWRPGRLRRGRTARRLLRGWRRAWRLARGGGDTRARREDTGQQAPKRNG